MSDIITPSETEWDTFVRQQPDTHFLQFQAWAQHKAVFGWDFDRIAATNGHGQIVAGAQLLFRPLPLHLGTMAYLPMGPYIRDERYTETLWQAIDQSAKAKRAAFLKWEPGLSLGDESQPDFAALGFHPSPQTIQPPNTILIDVRGTDEEIMARMNQGTRRKIRQSMKNDINYYFGTRDDIKKFNNIIQVTGDRKEFGVHDPAYYELAYDLFIAKGDGVLIMAEHEEDVLAGIMVFAAGMMAWYPYGASSNHKRNLMASYGVQWEAIKWARERGCHYYDLWGIPDADEATLEAEFQEHSEGLWGVYGFKRGWGGEIRRSAGAWDKVYNPLIYTAYKTMLRIRK